jgi:hypothetical protein
VLGQVDGPTLGLVRLERRGQTLDIGVGGRRGPPCVPGVDRRPEVSQHGIGLLARLALVEPLLALVDRVVHRVGQAVGLVLHLVEEAHLSSPESIVRHGRPAAMPTLPKAVFSR